MTRRILVLVLLVTLGLAVGAMAQIRSRRQAADRQAAAPQNASEQPAATDLQQSDTTGLSDDEAAIRRLAAAFAKHYNAHDAKSLARLFTTGAEMIDEGGEKVRGRHAIEQSFAAAFAANPKTTISIEVDNVRLLAPTVAVEEGVSTVKHEPGDPSVASPYSVVHVKGDTGWLMGLARDLESSEAAAAAELEQLGWLVGTWVDESHEAVVRSSYRWSDTHQYLLGQFAVQIHGQPVMSGSERIAWDPVARQLRSWVFDSEGGFAEGLWSRRGSQWVVKTSGTTRDGRVNSATNVYRRSGSDRYELESRDRVIAGQLVDDSQSVAVREPPKPAK